MGVDRAEERRGMSAAPAIERAPESWETSHFAALGRTLEQVFELADGTMRYVIGPRDPRAPTWRSATRRRVIPRAPHLQTGARTDTASPPRAPRTPPSRPRPVTGAPVARGLFDDSTATGGGGS